MPTVPVNISAECVLPLAPQLVDGPPKPVTVCPSGAPWTATLGFDGGQTGISVRYAAQCDFAPGQNLADYATGRPCLLAGAPPFVWDPVLPVLFEVLLPIAKRMAVSTGHITYVDSAYRPVHETFKSLRLTTEAHDVDASAFLRCTVKFRDGVRPPQFPLTNAELATALKTASPDHEAFLVLADRARAYPRPYEFVAATTTAMEVACYAAYERKEGTPPGNPFTPTRYLGTGGELGLDLRAADPTLFADCEELWGARHEFLHNGKMLVRPFDPTTGRADRSKPRPYDPGTDQTRFRLAVAKLAAWLVAQIP